MAKVKYVSKIDNIVFFISYAYDGDYFETVDDKRIFKRTDGQDLFVSRSFPIHDITVYSTKLGYSFTPSNTMEIGLTGAHPTQLDLNTGSQSSESWNWNLSGWSRVTNTPDDVFTLTKSNPFNHSLQDNSDSLDGATKNYTIDNFTVPADVSTNLVKGSFTDFTRFVIYFQGNIKTGDTVTLTQNGKTSTVKIQKDVKSMATTYSVTDGDHYSVEYKHANETTPTTPTTPKQYQVKVVTQSFNTVTAPVKTGGLLDGYKYYVTDSNKTITIKTINGKIFSTNGTFVANGVTTNIPATNTDTVTFTIPASAVLTGNNVLTMEASDKPKPSEVALTSSDPNLSWSTATVTATTGQKATIKIKRGARLYSGDKLTIAVTDKSNQQHGYSYTLNGGLSYDSPITLNLPDLTNAKSVDLPQQIKLIQQDIYATLQNADIIVPATTTDDDGKHNYVDRDHRTITVKAHAGYLFTTTGELSFHTYGHELDQQSIKIKATNTDTVTVELPVDFDPSDPVNLTLGATKQQLVENTGGFVNLYKADYSSLVKFSNDWISMFGNNGNIDVYDVASYISNLVMIPLDVPEKLVNAKSAIVAGNQTYKTEMATIDDTHYIYDLGSITTPEQYKNGFDYYQVTTRLVLPFTDTVDLKPAHVINKTVNIKYDIQFQTGDTTVILSNDDGVFFTKSFNIADNIPFVTASTNGKQYAVINKLQERFNNGVHQAYILIEQPTPVLNNDYYSTIERGQLKAYTGNVKAELLNNVNVPSDELNALQSQLRNGVKIK